MNRRAGYHDPNSKMYTLNKIEIKDITPGDWFMVMYGTFYMPMCVLERLGEDTFRFDVPLWLYSDSPDVRVKLNSSGDINFLDLSFCKKHNLDDKGSEDFYMPSKYVGRGKKRIIMSMIRKKYNCFGSIYHKPKRK